MSKIDTNRVLFTQQPIDQQKRPKADNVKNPPLSFNRPSTDTSLLSGVRKLIEHGRSFSVHSSSHHARKEERAQQLIARQQWLQEMESGVAAFHARVDPAAKVSASESSKATSGLQQPRTFTRPTVADRNRFSNATNRLWHGTQNLLGFHTQYSTRERIESANELAKWRGTANEANTHRWVNAGGQASVAMNEEEARQARMRMPNVPQAMPGGGTVTYF